MNWRTGLRKGRSHIILAVAMLLAGLLLIRLDDAELRAKQKSLPGKPVSLSASPAQP